MSAYLYPSLKSKTAYKQAIVRGEKIVARENVPFGSPKPVQQGLCAFEGPIILNRIRTMVRQP